MTTVQTLETKGTSPKAILAFFFPLISGIVAVVAEWVATGKFDQLELRTTIASFLASCLAGLGAYVGAPGEVGPVAGKRRSRER
jgi:hypothetical protein